MFRYSAIAPRSNDHDSCAKTPDIIKWLLLGCSEILTRIGPRLCTLGRYSVEVICDDWGPEEQLASEVQPTALIPALCGLWGVDPASDRS